MMSCIEIMDFCIASCGVECADDIALGFFFGLVTGLYKKLLFENHHILSFRTNFALFLEPLNTKSFFVFDDSGNRGRSRERDHRTNPHLLYLIPKRHSYGHAPSYWEIVTPSTKLRWTIPFTFCKFKLQKSLQFIVFYKPFWYLNLRLG